MSVSEDLLVADFQQCFEQMRHYDEAFRNTLAFTLTGAVAVAGVSGTLLQVYHPTTVILATVGALLMFSGLAGSLEVMSLAKNRVYFAVVARYVNEIRKLYLDASPGRIANKTGIYSDYRLPPMFDPSSTHSFQTYLLSAFDSFFFACGIAALIGLYSSANGVTPRTSWFWGVLSFLVLLVLEVALVTVYWQRQESIWAPKTTSRQPG